MSLGVTPSGPRSIPRCEEVVPFEKMEFPRMAFDTPAVVVSCTPSPPLKAITFRSALWVPPIVLKTEPLPVKLIPFPVLPMALVPLAAVPMKFPSTRSLLLFENARPSPSLPEIRFTSAGVEPPIVPLKPE